LKTFNILVTGVGAIIGYGIIKSLRASQIKTRLVGVDIDSKAIGSRFTDKFIVGPKADSPHFIENIKEIYYSNNIDLIIPGIPQDVLAFSKARKLLGKHNISIVLKAPESLVLEQDKWKTYTFLRYLGITTPETLLAIKSTNETIKALKYPKLLKLRKSSAGKGSHIVNNPEECLFYLKGSKNYLIQDLLNKTPEEYTCGVFGLRDGKVTDTIIMKRELNYGSTFKAESGDFPLITDMVNKLLRNLKILGPTNIQIMVQKKIPYIIEINARVSSSSSLRTLFGFNEPEICIRNFLLKESNIKTKIRHGYSSRFIEDYLWK